MTAAMISLRELSSRVFLASIVVVLSDQISKAIIVQHLTLGEEIPVIPGLFNITLAHNPGAAFGMFANLPDGVRQLVLAVATLVALGAVLYFLLKDYRNDALSQYALSCILGGAIGNIIDRVQFGYVIDFLDVYIQSYHWPAFNIADSAICIGVAILLVRGFSDDRAESSSEALS